jgi:hypothetical protein
MSYVIFEKQVRRDTEPRVTISTLGRIQFNSSASRILDKNAVETVLLQWDKDARKVAIKSIAKKDDRAYKVRYAKKGKGAGFAAKTFLEWIGHNYSETKNYPCQWNEAESMFEVTLPLETPKAQGTVPRTIVRQSRGEGEAKRQVRVSQ